MDLNTLIIIDEIARHGSFSAAAKALKMPNSNLSLKVKQLESALGQPLFSRSTRSVAITEFGQSILDASKPILDAKEVIESLAQHSILEPRGKLRITAPYDVGLYLLRSAIPAFTERFEQVRVEVDLDNAYQDIISKRFDLAIRASVKPLADSTAIAIRLGETEMRLYAHRDSQHSRLKTIDALHQCPVLSMAPQVRLAKGSQIISVPASSRILVRDMEGIKQATLGRAGVGVLPEYLIAGNPSSEGLTNIFPDWTAGNATFYAMYPHNSSLTPKTKAFIEFVKDRFLK